MLITVLGEIIITVNDSTQQFEAIKLSNNDRKYTVDGRYKIVVNIPKMTNNTSIACALISQTPSNVKKIIESGEKLALISFYHEKIKLSIGVEDEIPNTICQYLDNGINVIVNNDANIQSLVFYVAWLTIQDKAKEDIFTWFAADPTLS